MLGDSKDVHHCSFIICTVTQEEEAEIERRARGGAPGTSCRTGIDTYVRN